jgi:hypothetical protein
MMILAGRLTESGTLEPLNNFYRDKAFVKIIDLPNSGNDQSFSLGVRFWFEYRILVRIKMSLP